MCSYDTPPHAPTSPFPPSPPPHAPPKAIKYSVSCPGECVLAATYYDLPYQWVGSVGAASCQSTCDANARCAGFSTHGNDCIHWLPPEGHPIQASTSHIPTRPGLQQSHTD